MHASTQRSLVTQYIQPVSIARGIRCGDAVWLLESISVIVACAIEDQGRCCCGALLPWLLGCDHARVQVHVYQG
jgi:hypothetical protein